MRVLDLIEALKNCDPDASPYWTDGDEFIPIQEVENWGGRVWLRESPSVWWFCRSMFGMKCTENENDGRDHDQCGYEPLGVSP